MTTVQPFQRAFIDLLVQFEVVRFGDFTLKSGRKSPYFVNAGQLRTGEAIRRLGDAFASTLHAASVQFDVVFGPSYKGVPLAVATASSYSAAHGDVGFSFDRKEAKDHGEGGVFVGTQPKDGQRVVIVDDVITSGKSIREAVELLRTSANVEVAAVVVAVDRMERGTDERSTLRQLQEELDIRVLPVVNVRQLVADLHNREINGAVVLDDTRRDAMLAYLELNAGT